MKGGKRYDLISIGEAVIDLLPGKEKNELLYMPGGAPLNCCVMAARYGCRTGFCGKISSDFYGHVLKKVLKENGIQYLCRNDSHDRDTTVTLVTLDENGERQFHFPRYIGADWELSLEDIDLGDVTDTHILHFGLRSMLKPPISDTLDVMLEAARKKGVIVSCDVNYRGDTQEEFQDGREKLLQRLPSIDIMKISREEALLLGGEDRIPEVMEKYGLTLVVETLGEDGAKCFYGEMIIYQQGFSVRPVDTTGAGDAFWGAFLATLLEKNGNDGNLLNVKESGIREAMLSGNTAASLTVRKKGAIAALPDRMMINTFLENV